MSEPGGRLSLKRKIYLDLKQKLIQCVYPPGSELNELLLTAEYGVSRTPIREAVSQLELEGYLKVLPKKGIYIPDISIDKVLQIFQTRLEVEPVTLRMAVPYLNVEELIEFRRRFQEPEPDLLKAQQLDTEMHLYLIDRCGNYYLTEMMHRLFDDSKAYYHYSIGTGVEASFSKKLSGGLKIGPKDGSYFIDLSDEAFAELIGEYLRPASKKILFGE